MTKESYYFSHDANARNDIKIVKLRRALGLEGYAIYFCLVEILREQKDYKLPLESINDIAYDLHTSEEKLQAVISMFDLFVIEDEKFFSARLLRSMNQYQEKIAKLSDSGRKGNLKRWGNSQQLSMLSPPDPNPIALKEIKGKENSIYYEKSFNEFWEIYDKKTDRSKCEKKFLSLKKSEIEIILNVVPKYIKSTPDVKYRKNPLTWLNGKCWEDIIVEPKESKDQNDLFTDYLPGN